MDSGETNMVFGLSFTASPGLALSVGASEYQHRLGGKTWRVTDESQFRDGPSILMTLDLTDPLLCSLKELEIDELPICCYLNSTAVMCEPQTYRLDFQSREAFLVEKTVLPDSRQFDSFEEMTELPEIPLRLRDLSNEECPVDSKSYHDACDAIMGRAPGFARVLGAPLWLNDPQRVLCKRCNSAPLHLMTLGYSSSLLNGKMFFGDFPLHFFLCATCRHLFVISHSLNLEREDRKTIEM